MTAPLRDRLAQLICETYYEAAVWPALSHTSWLAVADALLASEEWQAREAVADAASTVREMLCKGLPRYIGRSGLVQILDAALARLATVRGDNAMTTDEMKLWIDRASYELLLSHWRFAQAGDPYFQGEVGDYYAKIMAEKKATVGHTAAVAASKSIGWER